MASKNKTSAKRPEQLKEIKTPDRLGRITLGKQHYGKTFQMEENERGQLVLTPVIVIPEREAWLWKNPAAMAMVREGLAQSARGEVVDLGDFSQFINEGDED